MKYFEKEELNKYFEKELPIDGGTGESIEKAYIFSGINQSEAPILERLIIDFTLKASGHWGTWNIARQTYSRKNNREIDCLIIEVEKEGGTATHDFYFDLTDCSM